MNRELRIHHSLGVLGNASGFMGESRARICRRVHHPTYAPPTQPYRIDAEAPRDALERVPG